MKGLRGRLHCAALFGCTAIGIFMTHSLALGQGTPDQSIPIPEPGIAALFGAAAFGIALIRHWRK
jgi:hypothetical protein